MCAESLALRDAATIVIPTIGRSSLRVLLDSLAEQGVDCPVFVIDDRRHSTDADAAPLEVSRHLPQAQVLRSGGAGPAAARNLGWRHARTPWVVFLDDDVVPAPGWSAELQADLQAAGENIAGIQARVVVPLPVHRAPTDWERVTSGLSTSRWITADMAYRRQVLGAVGGFDERFPRAFREDSDLAIRVEDAGWELAVGRRTISHPVRQAGFWVSVRTQAGNSDDMLMRRLHGPQWRARAHAPRGRRRKHAATAAAASAAILAACLRRRRLALTMAGAWLGLTAEFLAARALPGPRQPEELLKMTVTSVAIPPAALWHSAHGYWMHRRAQPWRGAPDLVLFDRDGTLIVDVPYNGDPDLVRPMPGAQKAVERLKSAGVRFGVLSNQSGVGRGLIDLEQMHAVNARVESLFGPFETWQICPHSPVDMCQCRKPRPDLVFAACSELGVDPGRCVVIGDIGGDIQCADAAGAGSVLVPTDVTLPQEIRRARVVANDMTHAVDLLLAGSW